MSVSLFLVAAGAKFCIVITLHLGRLSLRRDGGNMVLVVEALLVSLQTNMSSDTPSKDSAVDEHSTHSSLE